MHDHPIAPALINWRDTERPLPTEARLTFVLVKEDGRWHITSAQTTPIAA